MTAKINKLVEETKKMTIKPRFDTNWNDLSDKLKTRCIGKMELKERLFLRSTSRTERDLVDSQKLHVAYAEFFTFPEQSAVSIRRTVTNERFTFPRFTDYKVVAPFIDLIMKIVSFEELSIKSLPEMDFTDVLSDQKEHFSIKHFDQMRSSWKDLFYFVEGLKPSEIETIKFDAEDNESFPFAKLLKMQQIIQVPFWQVAHHYGSNTAHLLAKVWMDNNAEIGKTFLVLAFKDGTMKEFAEKFKDRIVSQSKRFIRITTDNPEKHIALELGLNHTRQYRRLEAFHFIRMIVIPARLEETEYDWNSKEWMSILESEYRFPRSDPPYDTSDEEEEYYDSEDEDWCDCESDSDY